MVISLLAVMFLIVIAWVGVLGGLQYLLGVIIPISALCVFVVGFVYRLWSWGTTPVPFNIPTTAGQQRSLSWIKQAKFDSPYTKGQTFIRMCLEVLCFRSLFRNTKVELKDGPFLVYWSAKWLWLFALIFHYCFLVIFIRHFRFFFEPVPLGVSFLEFADGIMQVGVPRFYMTDALIIAAILFLIVRRLYDCKLRYISLANDYFPLFLILAVAVSGVCMRYISKTDVASIKVFTMGLVTFSPVIPQDITPVFYIHLFLVSCLLIYFPFSKLVHMGGIFFSPTRNMPNNSRAVHHKNPWNPPKEFRTYAEYENDFRDAMFEAGLPLEVEPEKPAEVKE